MAKFKFHLQQTVTIDVSAESGTVIGRAEYSHSENCYFIRMRAGDGRAHEAWWGESAISQDSDGEPVGATK